jgi:hypothetical protein
MSDAPQTPDTRPGAYFVTMEYDGRFYRLLGPFDNDHAAALAKVDAVRTKANELDPRAAFAGFGTCRLPNDDSVPIRYGSLNKLFNMEH